MQHRFVGFGFGPIQAGLFAAQAEASGAFADMVVAEVDQDLVQALRKNSGAYAVNVAGRAGTYVQHIQGVRLVNPADPEDLGALKSALAKATEIATTLPSVNIYTAGGESSPAALLCRALQSDAAPATLVYTAENNNHAAKILRKKTDEAEENHAEFRPCQFLDTVIGKMSQVVTDADEIRHRNLAPIVPGLSRALLVEEFNAIRVTGCNLPGFTPGIRAFEEKANLLPFEEAKLYGHNAIHALLGFLGAERGVTSMAELGNDPEILNTARRAFIDESGTALIRRHASLGDPLFTPEGFRAYAEDLIERIVNPHLDDSIARAIREPTRKLGYTDRIFGAAWLCVEQGIEPVNLLNGARAGLKHLLRTPDENGLPDSLKGRQLTKATIEDLLRWLWGDAATDEDVVRAAHMLA